MNDFANFALMTANLTAGPLTPGARHNLELLHAAILKEIRQIRIKRLKLRIVK